MSLDTTSPHALELLQAALTATDPSVRLVSPRVLRRVIKRDRRIVGLGQRVPHAGCYVIGRERLLAVVSREELEVEEIGEPSESVVLLVRPSSDRLATAGREELLLEYWRLLFHARVHQVLEDRLAQGRLTAAGLRHRIQVLGATEFRAARSALEQENRLLPPRDDAAAYVEFAASYLELSYFEPELLPLEFAGLERQHEVRALLSLDVDAERLFQATRLSGTPDPRTWSPPKRRPGEEAAKATAGANRPRTASERAPSEGTYRRRVRQAERARAKGNLVRAAITRMQAAEVAGPKVTRVARTAARAELNGLVDRLVGALGLTAEEEVGWRQTLPLLLPWAARGAWPGEARLLYDLQKVCNDHERELYAIDLIGWAFSLGRKPIKRPLPYQRQVLLLKHLRGAAGRVHATRLADAERDRLSGLLAQAVGRQEKRLREELRPILGRCLDEAGLLAGNLPERVGRAKLVEELLDLVIARGFVSLGDLRDVVARNPVKLPDVTSLTEWVGGDRLLRADTRLARTLDGVYHRGEFYLRGLQRLSSLAFGTWVGRAAMLFLVLPFGGAYFALEGLQHIVNPVLHVSRVLAEEGEEVVEEVAVAESGVGEADEGYYLVPPPDLSAAGSAEDWHLASPWAVVLLGVFVFCLLHSPRFRAVVWRWLGLAGTGLQVVAALPARFLRSQAIRGLLSSPWLAMMTHYLMKPAVPALLAWLVARRRGASPALALEVGAGAFLTMSLLLGSRLGRRVEALTLDRLEEAWHRLSFEVMPALIRAILDAFKAVMGWLDRLLYTVDEWLRFRGGQGRGTFVAKALLGGAWAVAAYLVRLTVVLMVEPTLNPVKHFPTVTVAAKLIIPLFPWMMQMFSAPLMFLGPVIANTFASVVFLLIPGLAGFLVWELKENWRLYAANRAAGLRPVRVGSHGETMRRLLRPGLHSGTLPRLFTKLRRAQQRAWQGGGRSAKAARYRESLHHLEQGVRHFVERDGCALLNASPFWAPCPVQAGQVVLGANRVAVEITCPRLGPGGLWVNFDERSRWVLAGVHAPAWLGRLSVEQREALVAMLAGLYKLAGVDVVQEQVTAVLPARVEAFDMVEGGLTAWSGPHFHTEVTYRLTGPGPFVPVETAGLGGESFPELAAPEVLYSRCEIPWAWWVRAWEEDQQGLRLPALPFGAYHILVDAADGGASPGGDGNGKSSVVAQPAAGPAVR